MRAVLKLEIIGDNYIQRLRLIDSGKAPCPHIREFVKTIRYGRKKFRPWVARIVGRDEHYGYARQFITGMRDYTDANPIGSRGIFEYFALTDGVYEVNETMALGRARRHFIRVNEGAIAEISKEKVERWINTTSESAS